jgi:hypothetical protein
LLAGMLALEQMHMKVEKYYAPEVDKNAVNISRFHYGHVFEHVQLYKL